jgi:hypothetical protein
MFDVAAWKAEHDRTMERIFKGIAETSRIMDGIEEMRTGVRPRHLHLVPPLEEDDLEAQPHELGLHFVKPRYDRVPRDP